MFQGALRLDSVSPYQNYFGVAIMMADWLGFHW